MNTIVKAIFNEFALVISEKYSIDASPAELYVIWKQTVRSMTVTTSFPRNRDESSPAECPAEDSQSDEEMPKEEVKPVAKAKPAKKVQEKKEAVVESVVGCPYAASRGANAGKKCGKTPAKDSHMCSTHKKYADKYPTTEKVQPIAEDKPQTEVAPPQKAVAAKGCDYVFTRGANKNNRCGAAQVKDTCYCSKHQKEAEKPAKKDALPKPKPVAEEKIIFAKDDQHFVMRGPRPLVCKSASEKIIIGKKVDGEIVALDEEDIEFCNKMKLKYDSPAKKTLEDLLDEVQGVNQTEDVSDVEDHNNDANEDDVEDEIVEEEEILEEED